MLIPVYEIVLFYRLLFNDKREYIQHIQSSLYEKYMKVAYEEFKLSAHADQYDLNSAK